MAPRDAGPREFKVVGTRPVRPDGVDKVTGRAKYGADLNLQGMVHGHIVRSPHAHAIIRSIDFSEALAMPGVVATMSARDLPDPGERLVEGAEIETTSKELTRIPTNEVAVAGKEAEQLLKLLDALEDLDDVQKVHSNADIDEAVLAEAM